MALWLMANPEHAGLDAQLPTCTQCFPGRGIRITVRESSVPFRARTTASGLALCFSFSPQKTVPLTKPSVKRPNSGAVRVGEHAGVAIHIVSRSVQFELPIFADDPPCCPVTARS